MFGTFFYFPFSNSIFKYSILFLITLLIFSAFFTPISFLSNFSILSNNTSQDNYEDSIKVSSIFDFAWPIPGYTRISSYFGKRNVPTTGASSYHSGIDIPALEGTNLYASVNGQIVFSGWGSSGGYTITLQSTAHPDIFISYCHVSPNLIVSKGDQVYSKQLIGYVGPKNVYNISNNPYKDSTGKPTNGATTGCHLHLSIKEKNTPVNPLKFFSINN